MPLKIVAAGGEGLPGPGDVLISIDGKPVNDFLDLRFYWASGPEHELVWENASGELFCSMVEGDPDHLQLEPEAHAIRRCRNKCLFCFVDQMPRGLRSSLYVKDDDYLFSFVYGNFITLTNLTDADFDRIASQRLSPLYVSVHATNPAVYERLTGVKQFSVTTALGKLTTAGIDLHCQIVLMPGVNDGDILQQTLTFLAAMPAVSVGVVPVGLTRFRAEQYRDGSPVVLPDRAFARRTVKQIKSFIREHDFPYIYLADAFYLEAGYKLPPLSHYDELSQLENGIGGTRLLLTNMHRRRKRFLQMLSALDRPLVMLTGTAMTPVLQAEADWFNQKLNRSAIQVKAVLNNFFGHTITTAGLLTAADVLAQCPPNCLPAVSSAMFNTGGITLDDLPCSALAQQLGGSLLIIDEHFYDWHWEGKCPTP